MNHPLFHQSVHQMFQSLICPSIVYPFSIPNRSDFHPQLFKWPWQSYQLSSTIIISPTGKTDDFKQMVAPCLDVHLRNRKWAITCSKGMWVINGYKRITWKFHMTNYGQWPLFHLVIRIDHRTQPLSIANCLLNYQRLFPMNGFPKWCISFPIGPGKPNKITWIKPIAMKNHHFSSLNVPWQTVQFPEAAKIRSDPNP